MGDKSGDLTRLENIDEFIHQDDSAVDELLQFANTPEPPPLPALPIEEEDSRDADSDADLSTDSNSDAALDSPFESTADLTAESLFEESETESTTDFNADPFASGHSEEEEEVSEASGTHENSFFSSHNSDHDHENMETESETSFSFPELDEEVTPPTDHFNDVKEFVENSSFGTGEFAGNPPYSIVIKNIQYQEDADEIFELLQEHKIVNAANEQQIRRSLDLQQLLVPQLSEYQAITLVHQLRKYGADFMIGLSQEIHPPNAYTNAKGLVSRRAISQNKNEYRIVQKVLSYQEVATTTTPLLEGKTILKYLGIISESLQLDEIPDSTTSLNDHYAPLTEKLQEKAFELGANAVVGINYQIISLPPTTNGQILFKVIAVGNAVVAQNHP